MSTKTVVNAHPNAQEGPRQKSVIVGRDGFPAGIDNVPDFMGGPMKTRDADLAALLIELITEVRELKEYVQENIH